MTYTAAAIVGAVAAVLLDLAVVRTMLLTRQVFWVSYAIVVFFQLVVNGVLTGVPVVRYDPDQIIGTRIVYAPFEDLLFGFALVLTTLVVWVRIGPREPGADR